MADVEIHEYMAASNGGRRRSFEVDGVTVIVEPHEDDVHGRLIAEFLAGANATVDNLAAEVHSLRASVPPAVPVRLLGPGCVRFRGHEMWLLNTAEKGWASWGVLVDGWDDLFRRYDVRVTGHGRDGTGEFWTVEPSKATEYGSNGRKDNG